MQNETFQEMDAIPQVQVTKTFVQEIKVNINNKGHTLAPEVRWFGIIVGSLSIVFGTFGNFLTILVIVRNRSMQTKFNSKL